jgi:cell division protein FtsQ
MNARRLLTSLLVVLLVAGAAALVTVSVRALRAQTYTGLEVTVEPLDGMYLVEAEAVKEAILRNDPVVGRSVQGLALAEVRGWLSGLSGIGELHIYPSLDGVLHVEVTQRRPIARLHTPDGLPDRYIDSEGKPMPLSPFFTARVPILYAADVDKARHAIDFVRQTSGDPVWSAFVDQVLVTPTGLEIIPVVGDLRVEVGDLNRLEEKLRNLSAFYGAQIARGDLDQYQRIQLNFKDQVVAQRRVWPT